MNRGGSGRQEISDGMGPSSTTFRQVSISLGIGALNGFGGKVGSGFAMGNFSAPGKTSEEHFMRSTLMSNTAPRFLMVGGRSSPMVRSFGQGGPGAMGNKRNGQQVYP